MHAYAIPRSRAVSTTRLRALLVEPGGRRRLMEAVQEHLGATACSDDEQLLLRASVLLEDRQLGDLEL